MTDMSTDHIVIALIIEIHRKLEEALSIVKAAETCALDGSANRSVQILMDCEGLIHESQSLFRATLTIKNNLLPDAV